MSTRRTPSGGVSIPRSGFCSFRPAQAVNQIERFLVSIPRSGFCSFRLGEDHQWEEHSHQFQSLGRDSVRSDRCSLHFSPYLPAVSIPRSGFCSFRPNPEAVCKAIFPCFNPSVGILFVQTRGTHQESDVELRFNPSVGILFVQTKEGYVISQKQAKFQSLGRDSVRSDQGQHGDGSFAPMFQSLGRDSVRSD